MTSPNAIRNSILRAWNASLNQNCSFTFDPRLQPLLRRLLTAMENQGDLPKGSCRLFPLQQKLYLIITPDSLGSDDALAMDLNMDIPQP